MDDQLRIIVGDDGTAFARGLAKRLRKMGCACSARLQTPQNLLRAIQSEQPHIIILDITQKFHDYASLIREIKAQSQALVFAVTAASNSYLERQLWMEGLLNIWCKPVDEAAVLHEITVCLQGTSICHGSNDITIECFVTELLRAVGVPVNLQGYRYLRHGILLGLNDPSLVYQITKGIYNRIAEAFDVTPSCVERNIRAALEAAWTYNNHLLIADALRCPIHRVKNKLSNSEFIALAVDCLLLDRRVKALMNKPQQQSVV